MWERERENYTWEFFGAEIGAQGRSTTKLAEVIVVSMGKVYREAGFDAIYQALEGAGDSWLVGCDNTKNEATLVATLKRGCGLLH